MNQDISKEIENAIRSSDPEIDANLTKMDELDREVEECIDFVDLDIAFSPVVLQGGTSLSHAVKIDYKSQDGRYVIRDPYRVLSPDEVKKARARFLILRDAVKPSIGSLF